MLFVGCFIAMEPLTYAAHRWVMHGIGWVLHRSHHQVIAAKWEANDVFPVVFAAITLVLMALANAWQPLWAVGFGITAYGAVYAFVHDLYIHQRLRIPRRMFSFLEPLRAAHRIHHLYGGEPYGMLCPIVSKELREKAAKTDRDPLEDKVQRRAATSSSSL